MCASNMGFLLKIQSSSACGELKMDRRRRKECLVDESMFMIRKRGSQELGASKQAIRVNQ